jgi:hypothetical protein
MRMASQVLLSAVYLMLVRAFTKVIMHITLILSILLNMYVHISFHLPSSHLSL